MTKNILAIIGAALLCIGLGFCIGWAGHRTYDKRTETIVRTDTLRTRDTVRIEQPVYISRVERDTMLVPIRDTIRVADTLYIEVAKEVKTYEGKDYKAQVSGYRPELDWIEVFPETTTIYKEVVKYSKPKPWGIGVQAGVGAGVNLVTMKPCVNAYVGIGISYNFIRF